MVLHRWHCGVESSAAWELMVEVEANGEMKSKDEAASHRSTVLRAMPWCHDKDGAGADEDDDLEALRARRRKQMKAGLSWFPVVASPCGVHRLLMVTQLFHVTYPMIFMIYVHIYIYIY